MHKNSDGGKCAEVGGAILIGSRHQDAGINQQGNGATVTGIAAKFDRAATRFSGGIFRAEGSRRACWACPPRAVNL